MIYLDWHGVTDTFGERGLAELLQTRPPGSLSEAGLGSVGWAICA